MNHMIPFSFCKNHLKIQEKYTTVTRIQICIRTRLIHLLFKSLEENMVIYNKYINFTEFFPCFFPYYTPHNTCLMFLSCISHPYYTFPDYSRLIRINAKYEYFLRNFTINKKKLSFSKIKYLCKRCTNLLIMAIWLTPKWHFKYQVRKLIIQMLIR